METGFAMVATKVNAFIAFLDPSGSDRDLSAFLHEASNALGLDRDADLARAMAIPPATLGSWKRRGKVPRDQASWFWTEFPKLVFDKWQGRIPPYSSRSVENVLTVIHLYYGDRMWHRHHVKDASLAFGGLLAFVPVIAGTYFDQTVDEVLLVSDEFVEEVLLGALEWRERRYR